MKSNKSVKMARLLALLLIFLLSIGFGVIGVSAQAFQSPYGGNKLKIDLGQDGIWEGYASGDVFVFHNVSSGLEAIVSKKPTTQEVLELSGVLATDVASTPSLIADILLQRHLAAAINRHAINTSAPNGVAQMLGNDALFYTQSNNNEFAAFFHSSQISFNGGSFAFAADNFLNSSGLIAITSPTSVKISIGGFADYSTTSLVSKVTDSNISLYPNPAHDFITIVGAQDLVEYCVFNISGVKIIESKGNSIDVSGLPANIYFVRINEFMFKVIKE